MALTVGQVFNQRYRIDELLGQGGFRAVYRAFDTKLEETVAIKESYDASPAAQKQFTLEARLLFRLVHPNLPRVHDYFILPEQGMYLVMDYIQGDDLQTLLRRRGGPLAEGEALGWVEQVCEALVYLHGQNPPVIHRDLKPANIRITPAGRAMLVDFGIAKLYSPEARTTLGARAITPRYSPPEQYGQGATDARSDVYALGATLYCLLTGQAPPDSVDLMARIAPPPQPVRALNPLVSERTSAAVAKAIALDREERWESITALHSALKAPVGPPALVGRTGTQVVQPRQAPGGPARPPDYPAGQTWPAEARSGAAGGAAGAGRRRSWGAWLVLTGMLVCLLAAGVGGLGDLAWGEKKQTPTSRLATVPPYPKPVDTWTSSQDGMLMVYIPAGKFWMGAIDSDEDAQDDEKPRHEVILDGFWMDITEVTNAMYALCVQAGDCQPPDDGSSSPTRKGYYENPQYADYPVIHVTWEQAAAYCQWAGKRLPTEAEWEKAARGGLDGKLYPWGDESPVCTPGASNGAQYKPCGPGGTVAVGSFASNGYGLFDMAGNVWEWVQDWYGENYYLSSPAANPAGPETGIYRVVRGGSWLVDAGVLRVSNRSWVDPASHFYNRGFRCSR